MFLASDGRRIVFSGWTAEQGREPWVTDGTDRGTIIVNDYGRGATRSSQVVGITTMGRHAYFAATVSNTRIGVFRTDGTSAGTRQLSAMPSGSFIGAGFVRLADRVYFVGYDSLAGSELWETDGTIVGTKRLADLEPGPNGSHPRNLVRAGDRLFFTATTKASGSEVWVSDGTAAGTRMVDELAPGARSANPRRLVAVGDLGSVVFSADDAVTKEHELFTSDGTPRGTKSLQDPTRRHVPSQPWFYPCGNQVYFYGFHGSIVSGLWVTDGQTARAMPQQMPPLSQMTQQGGYCYFARFGSPPELWRTDGTAAGTREIMKLPFNLRSAYSSIVAVGSRHLYVTGWTARTGEELWRVDPTAKTVREFDIRPGVTGSSPTHIGDSSYKSIVVEGRLLFLADGDWRGSEIWRLENGATATPVGTPCGKGRPAPRLALTDPLLGATMQIGGRHAPTGSVGAIVLGAQADRPVRLGSGCSSVIDLSRILAVEPFASRTPTWTLSATVPNVPALSGVSLAWQVWYLPISGPRSFELTNGVVTTFGNR